MTSLNEYTFCKKIGTGAFGQVFEAYSIKNKKLVAIKVVTLKEIRPEIEKLTEAEINISKSLNHENIVRLQKCFIRGNTWYLVMEYCENGNLEAYLRYNLRVKEDVLKTIAHSLGSALRYLEKKNIAHRDIKLANIVINHEGKVKLTDLGFAKLTSEQEKLKTYAGTRTTMAPEIANSQKEYSVKCDVWSYGVVLFQLFHGRNIFYQEGKMNYQTPLKFQKSLSPLGQDFLAKCLKTNQNQRMSASQLMNHPWLQNCLPKYLDVIPYQSTYKQSQEDNARDILEQYDLSIARSFNQFKQSYNRSVRNLHSNFLIVLSEIKSIRDSKKLLQLLFKMMNDKIKELGEINVRLQLPHNSFTIGAKLYSDLIDTNKKICIAITKQIKSEENFNVLISENVSHDEQLVYDLLKMMDSMHPLTSEIFQPYKRLWKIVLGVVEIIQSSFKNYVIKLNYHQSLSVQQTKQISQLKKIQKEQIQDIFIKMLVGVDFQKKDVFSCEIEQIKQKNNPSIFRSQLLGILKQIAIKL